MTDFVNRPQSFDGGSGLQSSGASLNSRFGCSMLLLPQGNPLGRRKSFIHQVETKSNLAPFSRDPTFFVELGKK
jgi:hypothetical protein